MGCAGEEVQRLDWGHRKEVRRVNGILGVWHPSTPWPGLSLTQSPGMRETDAVCPQRTCSGGRPWGRATPTLRPHSQPPWRLLTSRDPRIQQMGSWLFSQPLFLSLLEPNFIFLVLKVSHTFWGIWTSQRKRQNDTTHQPATPGLTLSPKFL